MSSTRPGIRDGSPGTTDGISADGKEVVVSRHALVSSGRTSASTAHWATVGVLADVAELHRQGVALVVGIVVRHDELGVIVSQEHCSRAVQCGDLE